MPWTPGSFKSKHNHKLTSSQAKSASAQANAILRSGASEGTAIAVANKRFEKNPGRSAKQRTGKTKSYIGS